MSATLKKPGAEQARKPDTPARLSLLIKTLLAFEASLYAAITPILPHYAHVLHLSKPAVGILSASYTAGLIPGAFVGGWMAARAGVRRTTVVGLVVFAGAVAAFGFGSNIVVLDALRGVQGVACGCIWGGALTWVIAATPASRRGAAIGSVIGAAIFGTLVGPAIGTLAAAAGSALVFSLVGVVSLALAGWVITHPAPPSPERGPRMPLSRLFTTRGVLLGAWMVLLEAMTIGAANALLPLRLSRFGATTAEIGATFVLAAAISTVVSPLVGRLSDRRGVLAPMAGGLAGSAVLVALLPLPNSALALAALTVVAFSGSMTAYVVPATSLLTASTERAGIAVAVAVMLFNLAYAIGETIGAPAAAGLSQATSDAVPFLVLAALLLVTLWRVLASQRS